MDYGLPFNISCGHCWMCSRGLFAQCETTRVREHGEIDPMPMMEMFVRGVQPRMGQAHVKRWIQP